MIKHILAAGTLCIGLFGASIAPASAVAVNSFDCSGIDTMDGTVGDWENIQYLINTDDSVKGTTYYLDSASLEWSTTEPSSWRYSANLEQQANIQQMKVCNTDTFFLMLRTEEPMMMFYDKENDTYVDIWNGQSLIGESFTLPADYHYWMVWKMQDVEGAGGIIYLAADLTMDKGRVLNGDSDREDPVPKLYLYRETDTDLSFDEATFDASNDTRLAEIELSNEDESDCPVSENGDPKCEPEVIEKSNLAFEVSQNITQLFKYADFKFGDTINMSAAMYNSDSFGSASTENRLVLAVADTTDTKEYTFTQRPVRKLTAVEDTLTDSAVRLKWKPFARARAYQIRLINPETDEIIKTITKIKVPRVNLSGLDSETDYRAVVRAVLPLKNGTQQYSAWSSGYRWTTEATTP